MNKELTNRLLNAYPLLYSESPCFECGDGWFDILNHLSNRLEHLIIDHNCFNTDEESLPCAIQVKEKFGTLRFYMSCQTDKMSEAIEEAEEKSSKTCENCGRPAKIRGKHWFRVTCDECEKIVEANKCFDR